MSDDSHALPAASIVPEVRAMEMGDIGFALRAGLRDFRRKPMMGLIFSGIYVVGGWLIYAVVFVTGQSWWAVPLTTGFPLLAPFLAVGLYEVSRRLEQGETNIRPSDIFGVVWQQRLRQLPLMSWVIIVYFLFWSFFAHMLFAMFIGPSVLINPSAGYAYLLQPEGMTMLAVGTTFGAVFAFILFCLTVISLPLLLDKELDFITAMLTSIDVVKENPRVLIVWGVALAGLTFVSMLPAFLGLFIALPVLGHASWHIYRRALQHD